MQKRKTGAGGNVVTGVVLTLLLSILGAAIGSWLITTGRLAEERAKLFSLVVLEASLILGLLVNGIRSAENIVKKVLSSAGVIFCVVIITNLLLAKGEFGLAVPVMALFLAGTIISLFISVRKSGPSDKRKSNLVKLYKKH